MVLSTISRLRIAPPDPPNTRQRRSAALLIASRVKEGSGDQENASPRCRRGRPQRICRHRLRGPADRVDRALAMASVGGLDRSRHPLDGALPAHPRCVAALAGVAPFHRAYAAAAIILAIGPTVS